MTYATTAPERCDLDNTRTLRYETDRGVTRRVVEVNASDVWCQLGRYTAAGHQSEAIPEWVEAA